MTKRMLIDATHDEETRVAVVDDGNHRILEYDYENKYRKPLKGSIFLAKVTRVEPSLQAAFVNFGGNRHGFLPFSEIHPDYFRIPISDREALIAEQEEMLAAEEERQEAEDSRSGDRHNDDESSNDLEEIDDVDEIETLGEAMEPIEADGDEEELSKKAGRGRKPAASKRRGKKQDADAVQLDETSESGAFTDAEDESDDANEPNGNIALGHEEDDDESQDIDGNSAAAAEGAETGAQGDRRNNRHRRGRNGGRNNGGRHGGRNNGGRHAAHRSRRVEILGGTEYEDEDGGASERSRFNLRRQYKIQEVIKRGQIMLIQASREERGNKGAAVTTYLSLPGRYGVLMPNSPRAGGVSRKIAKFEDRQRMRETLKELDVPKGMSVILRTAGVTRTKTEIKRDVDYLMRLWDDIREKTLQSSAPALIYEEADLIKRAIRDLYARDVDEIIVAGEEGQKNAKKFMKMMIPSHVKKVKDYKDDKVPLFHKYRVESQIAEMSEPTAKLKSGGYLVINPTEALVSIDVNSGRATKERHIEETALNTNLEAAEEVARQLRLRDLGGLIVIDFIDMEDRRNNARVERKLKEALSGDRARIQIGRISSFGLLEMSRQRLNPSLTEAQYETCSHCDGRGVVRNCDSTSILLLRNLEEEGIKGRAAQLIVHVSNDVALYILNNKRAHLDEIESRYGFTVSIRSDSTLGVDKFRVEVARPVDSGANDDGEEASQSEAKDNRNNRESRETREPREQREPRERRPEREDRSERNNENPGEGEERGSGRKRGRRGGRNRGRNRNRGEERDLQNPQSGENALPDSGQNNQAGLDQAAQSDVIAVQQEDVPTTKAASRRRTPAKKSDVENADTPKDDGNDQAVEAAAKKPARATSSKAKSVSTEEKSEKAEKGAKESKPKAASKASTKAPKESVADNSSAQDVKVLKASNDDGGVKATEKAAPQPEKSAASEYEIVNEPPKNKKKGWWNKLVE